MQRTLETIEMTAVHYDRATRKDTEHKVTIVYSENYFKDGVDTIGTLCRLASKAVKAELGIDPKERYDIKDVYDIVRVSALYVMDDDYFVAHSKCSKVDRKPLDI